MRGAASSARCISPLSRIIGLMPDVRCRSLAPRCAIARSIASMCASLGTGMEGRPPAGIPSGSTDERGRPGEAPGMNVTFHDPEAGATSTVTEFIAVLP